MTFIKWYMIEHFYGILGCQEVETQDNLVIQGNPAFIWDEYMTKSEIQGYLKLSISLYFKELRDCKLKLHGMSWSNPTIKVYLEDELDGCRMRLTGILVVNYNIKQCPQKQLSNLKTMCHSPQHSGFKLT